MDVIEALTATTKQDAFTIRKQVFINEQGVDPQIEHDQYDQDAIHIVGYLDQQPIATARIRLIDNKAKIQRVAILKAYRKRGYGKQLMLALEAIVTSHGIDIATLHAQTHALSFYQSVGYQVMSEPFYHQSGIEHVEMEKPLR
ncbi:GNAT family N-acetyltransferase [Amphibacillus cookii]|uniref:GNAT family N-acetyltransferase n=1 Tax=Amphibacillus cookii TaxID=767787 RepID=UPI00195C9817|nr:GNAT family N-acetyltransferase [Amphibacillus cookii]MBM7540188.1 putative GNAT family N-acyltransferase [Amphibacillus cookii]